MSRPAAYVFIDLDGVVRPVGTLFVRSAHGRETASFHYASEWLNAQDRFALQPALEVSPAPHYTVPGRALFGTIADSAPDRWGQTLLRREERRRARAEERTPRSLREITASLELAFEVVEFFDLEPNVARSIAADVATTVSTWRSAAAELGLKRGEIERMESAFENADLASALQ
ncbi:MAG: HipA N-terminal domain-containing protein [Longimicrobiales bacterium]